MLEVDAMGWGLALLALTLGCKLGMWAEAVRWREKGGHDYMNRMESAGRLYHVKREDG